MGKTVVYLCDFSAPPKCEHRVCLPNNPAICIWIDQPCSYRNMAVKPETCNPLHPDGCTGIPEPEIKKPEAVDPGLKRKPSGGHSLAA
jgi:hypothetical protein